MSTNYKGRRPQNSGTKRKFQPKRPPQEFKARKYLPRGVSFTIYDIQGTAISPDLVKHLEAAVEQIVLAANIPGIGIDVRKG